MKITRDKEIWAKVKHNGIDKNKYSISSLGRVKNKETNEILPYVNLHNSNNMYVHIKLNCEVYTFIAVWKLMLESFTNIKLKSGTCIYYKNGNPKDLFIGNFAISQSVKILNEDNIHEICELLEQGLESSEIANIYFKINRIDLCKLIKGIQNGRIYRNISRQYQI